MDVTDEVDVGDLEETIDELGEYTGDGQHLLYQCIADIAGAEEMASMDHPMTEYERESAVGMLIVGAVMYANKHGIDVAEAVKESCIEIETHLASMEEDS